MSIKLQKTLFVIWLLVIFIAATLIWYSPVLFKGYPATHIDAEGNITIARNYSQYEFFGSESDLNVVVAPSLVKSLAKETLLGNKITIFSYSIIFNIFGQLNWDKLVVVAIIIQALALVFFNITIFYLFGFKESILFSFIYILMPVIWKTVYIVGAYEFAILFFSIFTVLFFCFRNYKYGWPFLILAGCFLSFSGLAREAMFLSFPVILIWLWFSKKLKEILLIFIPVVLLLVAFWLPSFLKGENDYLKLFVVATNNEKKHSDFQIYGHLYPDPYTYYFDNQSILNSTPDNISNSGWLYSIGLLKSKANLGIEQVNIFERLIVGTTNLARQISKFLALEDIGGPLIFILMLMGLYQLKNKNKEVYYLFISLMVFIPLLLSYVVLGRRSHLVDFGWVIASLVALGLVSLETLFKNYYQITKHFKLLYCFVIILVFYNLILTDHVYWGNSYDNTKYLEIKYSADKIISYSTTIKDEEVIAVGEREFHPSLNYLTGKSIVIFDPGTIYKLIDKKELTKAFNIFGIKYIIGYDQELSELIMKNSDVINISNWPDKRDLQVPLNYNKSWLLNLIK